MDSKNKLKSIIREVFQEEIRDILLEALKSSMVNKQPQQYQNNNSINPQIQPIPTVTKENKIDQRAAYSQILNETQQESNQPPQPLQITGGNDLVNGTLPNGEVGLDLILNLTGNGNNNI